MTFQVNYLSQFYLTVLLCEEMKKKPLKHPFRVINLASSGYLQHPLNFNDLTNDRGDFEIYSAYGRSKLAMMLFTFKLHYQHAASTPRLVQAVSVNPGKLHYFDLVHKYIFTLLIFLILYMHTCMYAHTHTHTHTHKRYIKSYIGLRPT